MSYLDHIRTCNAHDLGGFRPVAIEGARVGWVRHGLADRLSRHRDVFTVTEHGVTVRPELATFQARSEAFARVIGHLVEDGVIDHLRREDYPVTPVWGRRPLLALDRAAAPYFGIAAFGLHVNGFVRRADGIHMWIGRRAADRRIAPGKLDNLVAGGQPHGLSLAENLIKEAAEEASIGADLARSAVPVGTVSYCMETEAGLKPDTLFCYDLELSEEFRPDNSDGEVEEFHLWPIEQVARTVRETDEFKFNCNLVIIDFLIRHGILTPDEAGYTDLVLGLHRVPCEIGARSA